MADLVQFVNTVSAWATIAMQVVAAALLVAVAIERLGSSHVWANTILRVARTWATHIVFFISASGVAVSLFYSDIVGYPPCVLCWWQRMFLYPIAVIAGVALLRRFVFPKAYVVALAALGFLIAIYHISVDWGAVTNAPCAATGVSCTIRYVSEFNGYVTIPMMSFTAFALIIVLAATASRQR